jgi:peptidoglycan/LPS O-acetylase OafA/YrhL
MKPLFWPLLGSVRLLLAMIVACDHVMLFDPASEFAAALRSMSGLAAVLGFLVISGFSIAASHAKDPAGFYRRRALRILPLYILAILLSAGCVVPFGGTVKAAGAEFVAPGWSVIWQNLVFAQGVTGPSIGTNAVVWTLSIEVILYAVTPLLARLSQAAVTVVAAGSLGLFMLAPYFYTPYYTELRFGSATALLAWAWLAGFVAFRHRNNLAASMALLAVLIVALNVNHTYQKPHWHATLVAVTIVLGFGDKLRGPAWLGSFMSRAGDASYPMYLFHLPVCIVLAGLNVAPSGLKFIAAALAVAVALDRLYDQPIKRLFLGNEIGPGGVHVAYSGEKKRPVPALT